MFNIQYYEENVQEIYINQLFKRHIKCNKCFLIIQKNGSKEEIEKKKDCLNFIECDDLYLFFDKTTLPNNPLFIINNNDVGYKVMMLASIEELYDALDLEISILEEGKSLVIIYDDEDEFAEVRNAFLDEEQASFEDWNEKMSQPLKPVLLSEQEIVELREQGRI